MQPPSDDPGAVSRSGGTDAGPLEIFCVVAPGLEGLLADEAREAGFAVRGTIPGGVTLAGDWAEVWRANLTLRGATRVLVRLAAFRAMHPAQLDKRARKLPWRDWLAPDVPVKVEVTCRKSRIYHAGAAADRIEGALAAAGLSTGDDGVTLKVRIEDDLCTVSIDTSGDSLHRRGLKQEVNRAPLRETLAALFLRAAGFDGTEPVVDPMCGSGTFPIEAAEIAAGLWPGRARTFAFERLATFDAVRWDAMRRGARRDTAFRGAGSDRDQGAVRMSRANADRAGVSDLLDFACLTVSDAAPPEGPPGLVICNPPYGGRIGAKSPLYGLYAAFGARTRTAFPGWRVAMVTSEPGLARATGLDWADTGPVVDHGGRKIRLYRT